MEAVAGEGAADRGGDAPSGRRRSGRAHFGHGSSRTTAAHLARRTQTARPLRTARVRKNYDPLQRPQKYSRYGGRRKFRIF